MSPCLPPSGLGASHRHVTRRRIPESTNIPQTRAEKASAISANRVSFSRGSKPPRMPLDWNESFAKAHRANIDPQPRMHPDARSADEGAGGLAAADTASSPATSIDKSGEQLGSNGKQPLPAAPRVWGLASLGSQAQHLSSLIKNPGRGSVDPPTREKRRASWGTASTSSATSSGVTVALSQISEAFSVIVRDTAEPVKPGETGWRLRTGNVISGVVRRSALRRRSADKDATPDLGANSNPSPARPPRRPSRKSAASMTKDSSLLEPGPTGLAELRHASFKAYPARRPSQFTANMLAEAHAASRSRSVSPETVLGTALAAPDGSQAHAAMFGSHGPSILERAQRPRAWSSELPQHHRLLRRKTLKFPPRDNAHRFQGALPTSFASRQPHHLIRRKTLKFPMRLQRSPLPESLPPTSGGSLSPPLTFSHTQSFSPWRSITETASESFSRISGWRDAKAYAEADEAAARSLAGTAREAEGGRVSERPMPFAISSLSRPPFRV